MSIDVVIEVEDQPGALAAVAAAVSDAGVNLSAATHLDTGHSTQLHILVPHAEPVRHALAVTHGATITREREVVVVQIDDDKPGVLADLTRSIAEHGVNLDLVYVATHNRVVFGSPDLEGLKKALAVA